MRLGGIALLLLLAAPVGAEPGAEPEGAVFVELTAARPTCYVHERVALTVRIGYDAAHFAEHAAPLFRQSMDVPLQVDATRLRAMRGVTLDAMGDVPGRTFVLDDEVRAARLAPPTVREGRSFEVLELAGWFEPTEPGTLTLEAPTLRYAYAERLEEDFVGGRIAVGRRDLHVSGTSLTLEVRPFPDPGRPAAFEDAVGRFEVQATVDPLPDSIDRLLAWTLVIRGEGNLATLTPPGREAFPGFEVHGVADRTEDGVRTLRYEMAATDPGVGAVPAVDFVYFDPAEARYRTVRLETQPIEGAAEEGERDGVGIGALTAGLLVAVFLVALLLLLYLLLLVRTRHHSRALAAAATRDAEAERAASHRTRLRPGPELERDLIGFLARRLGCAEAAVISPDLAARLVETGTSVSLAERTAALLEQLMAARYGGDAGSTDTEAVAELLEEWRP